MNLFIDTNIFLDLLLDRKLAKAAKSIILSIQEGLFEATIADITLLNIDYIAKKQTKDIKEFINFINLITKVVGANNEDIAQALLIKNNDFEDNLQLVLAKRSNCAVIISNDLNFPKSDLRIFSSEEFVTHYLE